MPADTNGFRRALRGNDELSVRDGLLTERERWDCCWWQRQRRVHWVLRRAQGEQQLRVTQRGLEGLMRGF